MNNATVFAGALVALAILGLMLWGRSATAPNLQTGTSAFLASEAIYDFGTISMKNGTVERMFEITNPTDRDVIVERLTTSCMCTNAYIVQGDTRRGPFGMPGHGGLVPRADETVPAGGTRSIAVVYDPNAHGPAGVGPIDRLVYLEDDGGGILTLEIKATVTP